MLIVKTCYRLSSKKAEAHSMTNWIVVGQLVDSTSNSWPLVYHSDRWALSTAWFHCTGSLVTADTCEISQWKVKQRSEHRPCGVFQADHVAVVPHEHSMWPRPVSHQAARMTTFHNHQQKQTRWQYTGPTSGHVLALKSLCLSGQCMCMCSTAQCYTRGNHLDTMQQKKHLLYIHIPQFHSVNIDIWIKKYWINSVKS